jgi:hypothetical protein
MVAMTLDREPSPGHADQTPKVRLKPDRRKERRFSHADIAERAYELYLRRGGEHGHDCEDWLRAERELRERQP